MIDPSSQAVWCAQRRPDYEMCRDSCGGRCARWSCGIEAILSVLEFPNHATTYFTSCPERGGQINLMILLLHQHFTQCSAIIFSE